MYKSVYPSYFQIYNIYGNAYTQSSSTAMRCNAKWSHDKKEKTLLSFTVRAGVQWKLFPYREERPDKKKDL